MKTQQMRASPIINVSARKFHHDAQSRILPRQYFSLLEAEHGGVGAGIVLCIEMRAPVMTYTFHADVIEPELAACW